MLQLQYVSMFIHFFCFILKQIAKAVLNRVICFHQKCVCQDLFRIRQVLVLQKQLLALISSVALEVPEAAISGE